MTHPQQPGPPAAQTFSAPHHAASLPVAVRRLFSRYAVFYGRASRSEFWWWALISGVVCYVLEGGVNLFGMQPAGIFALCLLVPFVLVTFIPSIALTVRRLHDVNMSGWFVLLILVPTVGALALLVIALFPGNPKGQRFDAEPFPG